MSQPRSIEFLARRVRINGSYIVGSIGPNGRQIGKSIEVKAGTEGMVSGITGGLTIKIDGGGTIKLKKDDVTLLPR